MASSSAIILLPLLVLTGCGRTPGTAGGPDKDMEPIVEYSRSGGFAGFDDRLTVRRDGRSTVSRRGRTLPFQVSPDKVAQLVAALDRAGFGDLDEEYRADGADLFTYKVTYKRHTVTAMDSAVPARLEPILRLLNGILDESGLGPR